VLVYSPNIGPRLEYIFDFLSSYYGQNFSLTDDVHQFRASHESKLDYSNSRSDIKALWISPTGLLISNEIKQPFIECFDFKGKKAFFKTEGDLPFDIFSAIFFLISRYEEYGSYMKDAYGRYAHENSAAFQNGFLNLPLVNIWLEILRPLLIEKDPAFSKTAGSFRFIPTYDIDIAWSYSNKGLIRNAGGMLRSFARGDWSLVNERLMVLAGKKKDPFDAYEWMDALHHNYQLDPVYFFHAGKKRNQYDKNIPPTNPEQQKLIRRTASIYSTGIHPSWHSGKAGTYREEKELLEFITGRAVDSSRQHFIRLKLPHTYRDLIDAGITNEYSMGYGSINGFRASVATPFYWYDLASEKKTSLLVHPFCFMDANSFYEQKDNPEQAYEEMMAFYRQIKSLHATMITVWHNSFLGTGRMFNGWRQSYSRFIASISSGQ
jgi:hypothetical protein